MLYAEYLLMIVQLDADWMGWISSRYYLNREYIAVENE